MPSPDRAQGSGDGAAGTLAVLDAVAAGRIGPHDAADLIRFARTAPAAAFPLVDVLALLEAMRCPEVGLLLRLDAPPDRGGHWTVCGFVTSAEDPSLLVPLAEARRDPSALPGGRSSAVRAVSEWERARAVAPCLGEAEGAGLAALSVDEAWRFLTQDAEALQRAGFEVRVPRSLVVPEAPRVSASGRATSPFRASLGLLSSRDLVRFQWEVALDGEEVSAAELEALARQRTPLVMMRDRWIRLSEADAMKIRRFWQENRQEAVQPGQVVRRALCADPEDGVSVVRATGWLAEFLEGIEKAPSADWSCPPGFGGTLRPYQVAGVSWLLFLARHGAGGCLADDMGLGKTVQVLAALATRRHEGGCRPSLVVCPTSALTNWAHEAAAFTPQLDVVVHHGKDRRRAASFAAWAKARDLVVTTYALLVRDSAVLCEVPWDAVVLDEAQYIRNADTLQARAARALPASWRVALTGTPVENSVEDLWSILDFLNPGLLEGRQAFRRRFLLPIQLREDRQASARLARLVRPFVLRRLKSDRSVICDLPDKMELHVACGLSREQAALYLAVTGDAMVEIERSAGARRKGLILATLGKLRQVCNHPAQYLKEGGPIAGRSEKLSRLNEMLSEVVAEGDRALVFTQYTRMGGLLESHLRACLCCPVAFIHGGLTREARDGMVSAFQDDGSDARILVLSLRAAGTALNLTRAGHVFHYDRWWNPAVEDQATDRAWRIGQARPVNVYKLVCAGTVEERLSAIIARKQRVAERVLGPGVQALTELPAEALRELFALERDEG